MAAPAINPFSQLRKEVKRTKPELIASGTDFELTLSPAEKLRAEENYSFGESAFKAFDFFTQHSEDISRDDIEHYVKNAPRSMSPIQRAIFGRVADRLIQSCERADEDYKQEGTELSKRLFALLIMGRRAMQTLSHEKMSELYRETKNQADQGSKTQDRPPQPSSPQLLTDPELNLTEIPQITATDLGSFVIRVKNLEDWKLLSDMDNTGNIGFKQSINPLLRQLLVQQGFSEDQLDIMGRTVFVADIPELEDQIEQVKRHELIHDLYQLAIRPETKTTYSRTLEKEIFLGVKDEIIAYLAGNEYWNPDLRTLATPIIAEACLDDPENIQYSPWELLESLAKKERNKLGEGTPGEERAAMFHQSMRTALREMARLHLLNSKTFDLALPALLGAQSFKEIAYHLSRLEPERQLDIVQASVMTGSKHVDTAFLINNLRLAISYDLSVSGLERIKPQMVAFLENLQKTYPDLNSAPPTIQFQYQAISETLSLMQRVRLASEAVSKAA